MFFLFSLSFVDQITKENDQKQWSASKPNMDSTLEITQSSQPRCPGITVWPTLAVAWPVCVFVWSFDNLNSIQSFFIPFHDHEELTQCVELHVYACVFVTWFIQSFHRASAQLWPLGGTSESLCIWEWSWLHNLKYGLFVTVKPFLSKYLKIINRGGQYICHILFILRILRCFTWHWIP